MFTHTHTHIYAYICEHAHKHSYTYTYTAVTHTSPNDGYRSFLNFSVINFAILILYFGPDSHGIYCKTLNECLKLQIVY